MAAALQKVLEDEGVTFLLGAQALETAARGRRRSRLEVRQGGETQTLVGSHLLVAVGRSPNTDGLNAEATGASLNEHGEIEVDEHLRAADGVYALGDVKGGPAFTHISYDDFRIVRDNLLAAQREFHERPVPYTLFTDPQLGRVGMTRQRGASTRAATPAFSTLPMSSVARAIENGETAGMMRCVVDDAADMLLWATVLGNEGGEVIGACSSR